MEIQAWAAVFSSALDGVCLNNISYTDDIVLQVPSISGLRKFIGVCGLYRLAWTDVQRQKYWLYGLWGRTM